VPAIGEKGFGLSPGVCEVIYKIIGVLVLYMLWLITADGLTGLFLLILIVILMLLRWRFKGLGWTVLMDQLLCILAAFYWDEGAFALALGIFEAAALGNPILSLPAFIYVLIFQQDLILFLVLLQSLFVGLGLFGWKKQLTEALRRIDEEGAKQYELERLKDDLLVSNMQISKITELSERSRIAREIHDNAGHDIIAAYMSLQTVEDLYHNDPALAKELYVESMSRLEGGIAKIREAVHNLSPAIEIGVDSLQKLCDEFHKCPIDFKVYGDSSRVPIYLWSILEPCMKEALTNIMRHSSATHVTVTLDITPHIVRLCVENDGIVEKTRADGIGLKNLRQRARAAGGNISTSISDKFRLVCVLPIQ
jgi:two-component system sensor histidine kinase DesK